MRRETASTSSAGRHRWSAVVCGGDEALYAKCAKELDTMGKAKFFFGAVGAGTRMKLCVNMVRGFFD